MRLKCLASTLALIAVLAIPATAQTPSGQPTPAAAQSTGVTVPAATAPIEPAGPMKIAVLDFNKILSQSKAAQSIDTQLKAKKDGVERELSGLERKLAEGKAKLNIDKDKVKPDVFSKEVAAYQAEYISARDFADSRQRDLKEAANVALAQLRNSITKIVAGMADKNGYTLVITRDNVVLALANMDITDAVLAQLDKSVTTIPVTFQSGSPKKAAADK